MQTIIYRLRFKTRLHLGRSTGAAQTGSLGLEKTETYISADTLFSAICQTWATFYDTQSLTDFLKPYTEESEVLPFTLTSAFPYAHHVYFYPKPLTWQDRSKESKRIQFVSSYIFRQIIESKQMQFDSKQLITGEKVWISDDEKNTLKSLDEDDYLIWSTSTRPRVTLGSRNSGSEIWHLQTVQFNKSCGLWFAAQHDTDETKHKIETLLRVLGDSGIGGERNAGYGQFSIEPDTNFQLPTTEDSDRFVTLSPICPKSDVQLGELLEGDTAYTLKSITGRVSASGSGALRKQINMFTEGSVFNSTKDPIGGLVNLKPDDVAHPVYRYGYAWQVGIKGASV